MKRITSNKLLLFFLSLGLVVCGDSSGQKPGNTKVKNPNIVFILADDMGYGDLGCYNPESKIPTPNMDKLASQGIKFLDAHSPAALCTPSRYGLLTGRYCWRTRLKKGVILGYDEAPLIEKGRSTIASVLKDKGYGTACFGKWHLGMNWQTKNGYQIQNDSDKWVDNPIFTENEKNIDFSKPVTGGPVELGFDYFFGSLGCTTSDPPYCFIENNHVTVIPSEQNPSKYNGLPGFVPGAWSKGFPLEEVDVEFTNKAISYMENQIKKKPGDPFFVYLALSSPHNPFLPPGFTVGKSKEGPRGDLVMVVDRSVGKITEFLREKGLEDNTLLIVTSDNGAVKGANGHLSEWKFRGYKSNIWEGGHRVPFIARWPGKIAPGTLSEEVISLTDMFASLSGLVSYTIPDNEGEDSYDVLPAILGEKSKDNKDAVRIFHSGGGVFAIRKGDWILIQGTSGSGSSSGTGAGSPDINPDSLRTTGQLYNLAQDPYQKINLWESKTSIRDSLAALLENVKSHPGSNQNLSDEFVNPPDSYFPGAFWCWLNGNMSETSITRDLEAMKSKGMNRAEIWDVAAIKNPSFIPAGGAFLGDESVKLIKHAISEGKRLKMSIGIVASSGWNAGGSWVTPEWASKNLFFSKIEIAGPQTLSIDLPFPELPERCPMKDKDTPVFYKDVAVLAVPFSADSTIDNISDVVNLTPFYKDRKLSWTVPEGKWVIQRFVCSNNGQQLIVPSPNSNGLFIDFFDPEATKRHLKHFMDRLGVTTENSAEAGLDYFEFDSMELAEGTPWTDSFPSIFKERRGYEIENYLPVLAGWDIKNITERFLYDFKQTVSDQLIYSHYQTGTEFLKKYNAKLVSESGGPGPPIWDTCPVDALKALGSVSVPRGEFWIKHRNMFLIKEVSSAAHIYGQKIVDAESFTTWRRWKDSPFDMKKVVDRAFCEGLNNITFHTFAGTNPEDGFPGRTYHAGYDMNPGTTWWNKSKPFMDYLSRCSYLLQQGLFVGDVCYYYGDQAPNFFPLFHDVPEKPRLKGLGKGYDYDVVNTDVILNRMSVKDDRLVLPDGMSYAVLLLPEQAHMPLAVLKKIGELVNAGATVAGPRPTTVPGLKDWDKQNIALKQLADDLWGKSDGQDLVEKAYGKGWLISGLTPDEVLKRKGIAPDFSFTGSTNIDYIHRTTSSEEIYFLRNESEEPVTSTCRFRVTKMYPEIWDASTGTISRIVDFSNEEGGTAFEIGLPAHGSVFVVFNKENRRELPLFADYNQGNKITGISGPWKVNFPPDWGAPPSVVFDRLISWTESDDNGIKYFSGTATYQNSFRVDDESLNRKIILDLGELRDVAEIFINGKPAAILWKKPYQADISQLVKAGENDLKIEIVNLWVNRMTGDMLSDPKDRYCKTNQSFMISEVWPGGDEPFRIQTAGLLGPVTISVGK